MIESVNNIRKAYFGDCSGGGFSYSITEEDGEFFIDWFVAEGKIKMTGEDLNDLVTWYLDNYRE